MSAGRSTPAGRFRSTTERCSNLPPIFVVTHSPDIARAFSIDAFLLLDEQAARPRLLRKELSGPVRQKYERWLDRAVVRALFAHIPLLVEGRPTGR